MATVTKDNTKIYRKNGWLTIVHDTGQVDAGGNPVIIKASLTQASIEKEAGVLLPKARIKTILDAALNESDASQGQELAGAL